MGLPSVSRRPTVVALTAIIVFTTYVSGCGSASHTPAPPPATTTTIPRSSATTPPAPTTTVYTPSAAQSSPDTAANMLIDDWANGEKPAADSIGTPAAVSALFAVPWPGSGLAIDRGCGQQPLVCTFGPPGGANPNDAIYELTMAQTSNGDWYVLSVQVLS